MLPVAFRFSKDHEQARLHRPYKEPILFRGCFEDPFSCKVFT
jgi:hypothetical protein